MFEPLVPSQEENPYEPSLSTDRRRTRPRSRFRSMGRPDGRHQGPETPADPDDAEAARAAGAAGEGTRDRHAEPACDAAGTQRTGEAGRSADRGTRDRPGRGPEPRVLRPAGR